MRKLLCLLPVMLLGSCSAATMKQITDENRNSDLAAAAEIMRTSIVMCADGNQVRFAWYSIGGNATAFTTWTILDENGKPKRCVKRPKAVQQFEEVPQ